MESIVEEYSKIEGREAFYIRAAADGFLKTIGNHGGLHTEDYFTIVYIPVENTDSLVRFFHKGNEVKFAYEWTDRGQLELFLCFSRMKRAAKDAKKYAYRDAA
jgi:hypothetical protein